MLSRVKTPQSVALISREVEAKCALIFGAEPSMAVRKWTANCTVGCMWILSFLPGEGPNGSTSSRSPSLGQKATRC